MKILPAQKEDIDAIVKLFQQYQFALQKREWYDWKYVKTPYEIKAKSFKIMKDDKIVGAVALLPRIFYFQGRQVWGIQAVDGLMGQEIRGKGLFNEVMSFLRSHLPEGITDNYFYISFPSRADSVKAHQNSGWHRLGDFERFAFFLNMNILKKKSNLSWIIPVLNQLCKLRNVFYLSRKLSNIQVHEIENFKDDVNTFFSDCLVFGDRSAAFMNWRNIDNPKDEIRSFLMIEKNKEIGFVICKVLNRNLEIMDLKFKYDDQRYLKSFIKYVQNKDLADSVDIGIFSNHPYRKHLKKSGFVFRRTHGALFVCDIENAKLPKDPSLWEISYIDSDW